MIDDRTLMWHASHALLSPLSSILNLTDILLGGIAGPISAQARKDVEEMAADAGALQQALDIVIDVLRIDGHRLRNMPLPLPVAVHRVADLLQRRTQMACTFDILVPEDLPAVHADEELLERLLARLLSLVARLTSPPITVRIIQHVGAVQIVMGRADAMLSPSAEEETDPPGQWLKGIASLDLLACARMAYFLNARLRADRATDGEVLLSLMLPAENLTRK